ncbi:hypothetical protein, partial [Eisenbergiella porci]|uniref:hypothetical protein n=1 Tax=Eisenbergiella porci TaxID=2652274 RepID=UPI002A90F8DE
IDRVVCFRCKSFQDAEKNSLRLIGEMGIFPVIEQSIGNKTGLISRHYLTHACTYLTFFNIKPSGYVLYLCSDTTTKL